MEPNKIKDLKKWWDWMRKHPFKASAYFIILILLGLILTPLITGFFGEKGKQLANPTTPLKSSSQPIKEQIEEHTGDIQQTAIGNGNTQAITTGDNSPIMIENKSLFKPLHSEFIRETYNNLSIFKKANNITKLRIKLELWAQSSSTVRWAEQYSKVLQQSDIEVILQPVTGSYAKPPKVPLIIVPNQISDEKIIKEFLNATIRFYSPSSKNIDAQIVNENISDKRPFDFHIKLLYSPLFDKNGRIYFDI